MVKGLRVTKTVEKIKVWVSPEQVRIKNMFQRQSWTKYLRETLVLTWNSALWWKVNYFSTFFVSIDKIFILAVRLSTRLDLIEVLRFSWCSLISKIVSLDQQIKVATNRKLFSNSWDNHEKTVRQSYMPCLLLITALCFTYIQSKIW